MSLLVDASIRVSLILAAALAATLLLRRGSAAARHWLLAAAVACALAAPLLRPIAPSWNVHVGAGDALQRLALPAAVRSSENAVPTSTSQYAGAPRTSTSATAVGGQRPGAGQWLGTIWAIGVIVNALLLIVGLLRLAWIASRAEPAADVRITRIATEVAATLGLNRPVRLLRSRHSSLLFTWGHARPKVLLPATAPDWSDDRIRIVLLHELAHIRRGDWVTQMAAELLRAAYWFNPFVWLAARRLRQESEHACDDVVLNDGVASEEYASHLLALARLVAGDRSRTFAHVPAPAMARPSSLERRFTAMLNARVNRAPVTRPVRAGVAAAAMALTLLVAGFGVAQTFAKFSGSAFDPTNRYLPGVRVILVNRLTHAKYEVGTDSTGRFEFVALPPGDYQWEAQLPGFAILTGEVTVSGGDVQQDLSLQVGSIEETITVRGAASAEQASRDEQHDQLHAAAVQSKRASDNATCTSGGIGPMGGVIKAPMQLAKVNPRYPPNLAAEKVGGVVVLEAVIGNDGDVHDLTVVRDPHPDLAAAASEAVRQWQYSVTRLNCEPIEVKMTVTVNFSIE